MAMRWITIGGALALLAENPSAIRRPVVEAGSRLAVGFDPAELESVVRP